MAREFKAVSMSVSSVTIGAGRGSPSRYLISPLIGHVARLRTLFHFDRFEHCTRWTPLPAVQKQLGSLRRARATMNAGTAAYLTILGIHLTII